MQTLHIQISSNVSSPFPRISQTKYVQYNTIIVPCHIPYFPKEALTELLIASL